jgi:hypothetical protein
MDEDRQQAAAGEEAAGPAALAAAGRFVPGGVGQGPTANGLINNLREQLGEDVDIDVDIDMGDMDESEDEDDEDDGLSTGSEEEGHSDDAHAQEGMAGEQVRATDMRLIWECLLHVSTFANVH